MLILMTFSSESPISGFVPRRQPTAALGKAKRKNAVEKEEKDDIKVAAPSGPKKSRIC